MRNPEAAGLQSLEMYLAGQGGACLAGELLVGRVPKRLESPEVDGDLLDFGKE